MVPAYDQNLGSAILAPHTSVVASVRCFHASHLRPFSPWVPATTILNWTGRLRGCITRLRSCHSSIDYCWPCIHVLRWSFGVQVQDPVDGFHQLHRSRVTRCCPRRQDCKYLRSNLSELGYPKLGPTTLFEDNAAAILMVNANRPTPSARHIKIQHFALQEWNAAKEIVLPISLDLWIQRTLLQVAQLCDTSLLSQVCEVWEHSQKQMRCVRGLWSHDTTNISRRNPFRLLMISLLLYVLRGQYCWCWTRRWGNVLIIILLCCCCSVFETAANRTSQQEEDLLGMRSHLQPPLKGCLSLFKTFSRAEARNLQPACVMFTLWRSNQSTKYWLCAGCDT